MNTKIKQKRHTPFSRVFEFAILGSPTREQDSNLQASIRKLLGEFNFEFESTLNFFNATNLKTENRSDFFVVVYFGNENQSDETEVLELLESNFPVIPVIPVIQPNEKINKFMPEKLCQILGFKLGTEDGTGDIKSQMENLAKIMLVESVGLFSHKRKIFISYVQEQSRPLALQLYEKLTAMKIEVFLDTHIIRYSEKFKNIISQQIVESDVMIMLDTSEYLNRYWTKFEFEKAQERRIEILRLPCIETRQNDYSAVNTISLNNSDFVENQDTDADSDKILKQLTEEKISEIIDRIEILRTKSVFSQFDQLVSRLIRNAKDNDLTPVGFGANFSVTIKLKDDSFRYIFPRLGFPSSLVMNDIANSAYFGEIEDPILTYNNFCFTDFWKDHLKWLDEEVESIQIVNMKEIGREMEKF